jgi:Uma2 family endonuclease
MRLQPGQPQPTTKEIFYPLAESDLHRRVMFAIIRILQRFFAGQQVYVSGNLLVYYVMGDLYKSVAPDCFVVRAIDPHLRNIYKIWEEGKGPEVVFEVSSKSTRRVDFGKKMRLYAELGVQEYFIYDPTTKDFDPPLVAYELVGGGYIPMKPIKEEVLLGELAFTPDAAEPPEYISQLLGLRLTLDESGQLQFYDLETNQRLLDDEDALALAEALVKDAELRATEEKQRAEAEKQRADQSEAENARLREEMARLRGER